MPEAKMTSEVVCVPGYEVRSSRHVSVIHHL